MLWLNIVIAYHSSPEDDKNDEEDDVCAAYISLEGVAFGRILEIQSANMENYTISFQLMNPFLQKSLASSKYISNIGSTYQTK